MGLEQVLIAGFEGAWQMLDMLVLWASGIRVDIRTLWTNHCVGVSAEIIEPMYNRALLGNVCPIVEHETETILWMTEVLCGLVCIVYGGFFVRHSW